jgi:ATP-dependent DNA helicase RecG
MTTLDEFNGWLSAPSETGNLEFKEAENQYDNANLFRHCVALANEGGGKLILGVTDNPPRKVKGSGAFHTPAGIQSKILDKLRFRVDVEEFQHPDGRAVIFHVPSRPRGTAYHLDGAYFMRSPDGTVPMSEDRLRQIFDEGKPDWHLRPALIELSPSDVIELLILKHFSSYCVRLIQRT